MTDWRALCAELAHEVERYAEDRGDLMPECAERARAALAAEAVGEGATDEELLSLDHLRESWNAQADYMNDWSQLGTDEIIRWAQRQALARWGHQPAPPAGELLKEAAWLRNECSAENADGNWISMSIDQALDLASLLERQATPVPVDERLPGAEDCDGEGRCWLFSKVEKEWRLIDAGNPGVPHIKYCFSHWLPATALPLPQGEVE